ncbi:MAG: hypothetical protein ACOZCL_01285 [Bacillota bacterium]
MWFDEIMDDCKEAILTVRKHKGIFVPIFIKLALSIALVIYVIIMAFTVAGVTAINFSDGFDEVTQLIGLLAPFAVIIFISYLIIVVFNCLMEVGSLNLYKAALSDTKPTASIFLEGIKRYFFRVFGGTLLIHLITLILSPLLIALFFIYLFTVGILSSGWGMIFFTVFFGVYFSVWTSIAVIEDMPAIEAIKAGFRLGKRKFKSFFFIILSFTILLNYGVVAFGLPVTILGGWFIAGIINTYFRVVIMKMYNRYKEEIQ